MTRKAAEPPRKVRWTVPGVDVSVIEWLDTQEDVSQSLRVLIRESIQRDGFIDVAFKPVEQLPRRGRPPGDESQSRPPGESEQSQSTETRQAFSGNEETTQPQIDKEAAAEGTAEIQSSVSGEETEEAAPNPDENNQTEEPVPAAPVNSAKKDVPSGLGAFLT